jgi:prepilin-type N-terminal cleavage/methylation domain-containing protein
MRKKAFTLIELLVVIAIIALLLSVIVPALRKAKDAVKRVVCSSNIRQVGIAVRSYAETYDGKLIPLAHNMTIDGTGTTVYSDNRGATTPATPWSAFQPWEGAVAYVLRAQGALYVPPPIPQAYHLGKLYELV